MAGLTINLLRIPTSVSAAADRPASYGNQIISSTRPSCWIQTSTAMRDKQCGRPSHVYNTDRPTKLKNRSLGDPLGHLAVTYALHLWLVGKPVVDFIFRNRTFFAISYGWDVMSGNRSKSAFFEGGGSLWAQISEGRGRRRPIAVGSRVAE